MQSHRKAGCVGVGLVVLHICRLKDTDQLLVFRANNNSQVGVMKHTLTHVSPVPVPL